MGVGQNMAPGVDQGGTPTRKIFSTKKFSKIKKNLSPTNPIPAILITVTYRFYVWDTEGNFAASYPTKSQAMQHAARIGGTWSKARY